MKGPRFLVLGGGEGWHANQLRDAAVNHGCEILFSDYESLSALLHGPTAGSLRCSEGELGEFDAVLTRTMPAGSLEQITFRLAVLHTYAAQGRPIVNSPRSLEIAIDKFATLAEVAKLGFDVPETRVVQSRVAAIRAFDDLGGDCVVKPIFGGEGRGVMRIRDRQLAWYTFATLEQLNSVFYIQRFVPPGGIDTRLLVIGNRILGMRRENRDDFRTNLSSGAKIQTIQPTPQQQLLATRITDAIGLRFASVDIIESADGSPKVLEVNAIPGWRGAQTEIETNIAGEIISLLLSESQRFRDIAG